MDADQGRPCTPDNKGRVLENRSFTLPITFEPTRSSSPAPDAVATETVEILFVHSNTSIVKFSTAKAVPVKGTRGLPWTSPTETTIAAGSLEIYRVPGSVSFLRSGPLLQPILPRSQCWCVDGLSKFAMRVNPETYYRIELPAESQEELGMLEGFKAVLARIMLYEKTLCPFARDSDEELPELEDIRNRRLRPEDNARWLDRSRLRKVTAPDAPSKRMSGSPDRIRLKKRSDETKDAMGPIETIAQLEARKLAVSNRSITAPPQLIIRPLDQSTRAPFVETAPIADALAKTLQAIPTDMPPSPPLSSASIDGREVDLSEAKSAAFYGEGTLVDDGPGQTGSGTKSSTLGDAEAEPVEDVEAFDDSIVIHGQNAVDEDIRSVLESPEVPITSAAGPPTSILEDPEVPTTSVDEETRSILDAPENPAASVEAAHDNGALKGPRKGSASSSEDPFAAIQARIMARRSIGGTTSFHPSTVRESTSCSSSSVSSSASSRSRISQIAQQRNLAAALVHKACAVFIGPPAHLVALMLKIAARFAKGTFGSVLFVESPSGAARHIPGSYEVDDEYLEEGISDDEDDFGVPLRNPVKLIAAKDLRERKITDGWEID